MKDLLIRIIMKKGGEKSREILVSEVGAYINFRETVFRLEIVLVKDHCLLESSLDISRCLHSDTVMSLQICGVLHCKLMSHLLCSLCNCTLSATNLCNAIRWCSTVNYLSYHMN